jgi:hypothetical protein
LIWAAVLDAGSLSLSTSHFPWKKSIDRKKSHYHYHQRVSERKVLGPVYLPRSQTGGRRRHRARPAPFFFFSPISLAADKNKNNIGRMRSIPEAPPFGQPAVYTSYISFSFSFLFSAS